MTTGARGGLHIRNIIVRAFLPLLLVASAFGLAAWSFAADEVRSALAHLRLETVLLLLAVSAFNYGARTLRWIMLFRTIDPREPGARAAAIPWHVLVYLGGFAFTLTPGRAGEAIRVFTAHRTFGTPADAGLSLVVADRFHDAVALTVILLVGAFMFTQAGAAPLIMLAVLVAAIAVLGWLASAPHFWSAAERRLPRFARVVAGARRTLVHLSIVSRPRKLPIFALPSLAGLTVQGLAPLLLLRDMGITLGPGESIVMFAFATLIGGATFLPGGLGGFEATMIGLLAATGIAPATAGVATLIMRLTTLWFGVSLGVVMLTTWVALSARLRSD
jgi:glycosyltransferase 2 family protein